MEAAVCVPKASGTMPLATAAAEPLDEPPGVRGASGAARGLRVTPGLNVANSVVTVLPMTTPPASRTLATTAASTAGRWPA